MTVNPLEVIERWSQVTPVPVYSILGELGLGPDFENLGDNISGWIERRPNGTYGVTVNADHAHVRQRFPRETPRLKEVNFPGPQTINQG